MSQSAETDHVLRWRPLNLVAVLYVGVGPLFLLNDPPSWLGEPIREHPWTFALVALWLVAMIRLPMLADPRHASVPRDGGDCG